MKVRIVGVHIKHDNKHYTDGDVADVSETQAQAWIANGWAEPAGQKAVQKAMDKAVKTEETANKNLLTTTGNKPAAAKSTLKKKG